MNPRHLRALVSIARHGSFTLAAEALGLSQPAVSRQVKALEEHLGVLLVERLGRTVHLTEAGERLVAEGERLLGDLERVEEAVRGMQRLSRARLRVGASTTPGLYLVPKVLGLVHAHHPEVQLHYRVTHTAEVDRALVANEIDVGFVGRELGHGLAQRRVLRDRLLCVTGRSHPLAGARVRAEGLSGALRMARRSGSATRQAVDKALEGRGWTPRQTVELDGPEQIKALVREGLGIAWLSEYAVAGELARGELVEVRVRAVVVERWIHMALHPDKRLTPALAALCEAVGAVLGEPAPWVP